MTKPLTPGILNDLWQRLSAIPQPETLEMPVHPQSELGRFLARETRRHGGKLPDPFTFRLPGYRIQLQIRDGVLEMVPQGQKAASS